jgi:hypothetical protein
MDELPDFGPPDPGDASVQEQLVKAARDLWCMTEETGEDYIVLIDRRRMPAKVAADSNGRFGVSWTDEDGNVVEHREHFENPREACFHAFQGPH